MKKGVSQQISMKSTGALANTLNLQFNKLENLKLMDKFLDALGQPKFNQDNISHLNKSITNNEIERLGKNFPKKKSPGSDKFTTKFYQTF
jgi:hypothetical protein